MNLLSNCPVLGCYRSGSSLLARMIHSLGVNVGPPFWCDHFEAADLSVELRSRWNEPQLVKSVPKDVRVEYLKGGSRSRMD